jgi:hypothetical protein
MTRIAVAAAIGALVTMLTPVLEAQSCFGNGGVAGSYGFVGSRFVFGSVPVTPPGTSGSGTTGSTGTGSTGTSGGTTPVVSNTAVGQLVGGVAGLSPFAIVGTIGADGAGNWVSKPSANGASTQVGTYSVNPDCTISVTLTDAFVGLPVTAPGTSGGMSTGSTVSSGTAATPPTPVSVKLEGLVLNGGAEIVLAQTNGTDTGAVLTLRRALQSLGTCTTENVKGPFGLVVRSSVLPAASGTTAPGNNSSSIVPTALIGRFVADGAGNFTNDALGSQSVLPDLQLTGTYAVNGDCSGTAQFIDSKGVAHNADFVIVQAQSALPASNFPQATNTPELMISITDQGANGFGFAKQD